MYRVGGIANPCKFFLRNVIINLEIDQNSEHKQVF